MMMMLLFELVCMCCVPILRITIACVRVLLHLSYYKDAAKYQHIVGSRTRSTSAPYNRILAKLIYFYQVFFCVYTDLVLSTFNIVVLVYSGFLVRLLRFYGKTLLL